MPRKQQRQKSTQDISAIDEKKEAPIPDDQGNKEVAVLPKKDTELDLIEKRLNRSQKIAYLLPVIFLLLLLFSAYYSFLKSNARFRQISLS